MSRHVAVSLIVAQMAKAPESDPRRHRRL